LADEFYTEHVYEMTYTVSSGTLNSTIPVYIEHGCRNWNRQNSITTKLYEILKNSRKGCILNKLVQSCIVTEPQSMQTERAVKCTLLKSDLRSCVSRDTVNDGMIITFNSSGTAHFDPHPAVAKFLTTKDRRYKLPEAGRYMSRDFMKLFSKQKIASE